MATRPRWAVFAEEQLTAQTVYEKGAQTLKAALRSLLRCTSRKLFRLAVIAQATLAVRGKRRTSKQVLSVPEATRSALQAWLDARGQELGPLFTNFGRARKGKRLTGVSLYRVVRDLGQIAGLKAHPHGLRHNAITEACNAAQANGIGLEEVLDFSRHSRKSIASLMVCRGRGRDAQGQFATFVSLSI